MLDDPEFENYMTDLIDKGAVVDTGELDPNGEPIYKFNLAVLKEIKPEMYAILMEELDADLVHLYQQGLVDISYNEDLEATFAVNEAGRHYMETGELPEPRV